jgi:hypothetical protein
VVIEVEVAFQRVLVSVLQRWALKAFLAFPQGGTQRRRM